MNTLVEDYVMSRIMNDKVVSRGPRILLAVAGLVLASACAGGDEAAVTSDLTDVGGGISVHFDLGEAPDAVVEAEAAQLLPDLSQLAAPRAGGQRETVLVRYAGKQAAGIRSGGEPQPDLEQGPRVHEEPGTLSFLAFNPASRNQYEVTFPRTMLARMHADAMDSGQNREVRLTGEADPPQSVFAWSGGVDNRSRFYGVDQPVTHWAAVPRR